jgi:NitT/TauT family transport system ATP-binding protein
MMSAAPAIHLEKVSKRYETGKLALQGIDLDIEEGDFITLVGPSGCGKSTLLRIMAGLGEATEGVVSVLGDATQLTKKNEGQLGFVFQDANLMPWRTVLENVELPLELRGISKIERSVEAEKVLQLVGLYETRHSYPRQLSGGMKMRVSIARALVSNPKILFMDEPFGALDEMSRHRLHRELLDIWMKARITVAFVTHNVFEAVYLSNKVAVMNASPGRIQELIQIDAPYPREDGFQASTQFSQYVNLITQALYGG